MVSVLTFKYLIHFELIFVSAVQFHLSAYGEGFHRTIIKDNALSPLCVLDALVKNQSTVYSQVYLWALESVKLAYISIFMLVPYCFDYDSFKMFEIRQCGISIFLLSQDCFGYLGSSVVPYEFQDCSLICANSIKKFFKENSFYLKKFYLNLFLIGR